jgi:adenylate cyclase
MLNKYLTEMSNIILDNQGTIDKYEGDAIIAFFFFFLHRPDHAVLACRSAIAMKKAERELNEKLLLEGLSPSPLFTRIGINTGEMVVGNMGTNNKMDYTVMGNSVNLAARLEGVNKQYKTSILISEFTKEQAGDEFLYRQLDHVRVVGIQTPVLLYELCEIAEMSDLTGLHIDQTWKDAMACYKQRQFSKASDLFSDALKENPNDKVADIFLQRCINYIRKPPEQNWDGVLNLSEK